MDLNEHLKEELWSEEISKKLNLLFHNETNINIESMILGQDFHVPQIIVATVTLQAVISFFGIIFNILVLVVLTFNRTRQDKSSVTYMINLATSDCLFLLTVPFKIIENIFLRWDMGQFLCKLINLITYLNFLVSPWFLTIMSIDRFLAVNRALSSNRFRTKRISKYVSAAIWIISLMCVFPIAWFHSAGDQLRCTPKFPDSELFAGNGDTDYMDRNMTSDLEFYLQMFNSTLNNTKDLITTNAVCKYSDPSPSFVAWTICNFLYSFFIPLLIIISCYCAIVRKLYAPAQFGGQVRINQNATRKRVLAMVAILVVVYILCYCPYYLWQLIKIRGVSVQHISTCSHLERFNSTMAYLNNAIDPIVYVFISGEFSRKIRLTSRNLLRRVRNIELNGIQKSKVTNHKWQNSNRSSSNGLLDTDDLKDVSKKDNTIGKKIKGERNISLDKNHLLQNKSDAPAACLETKDRVSHGKTKVKKYNLVADVHETSMTLLSDEMI